VLAYVVQATESPTPPNVRFHVDPTGLRNALKTVSSPVSLEVEGVPLKVTLRLILKQLGLAYCVKGGLVFISSKSRIEELLNNRTTIVDRSANDAPNINPGGPR